MTKIVSAGHYIPDNIITNRHLAEKFTTDFDLEDWIVLKTGIIERRQSDLLPSEQGTIAALAAMNNTESDIEFIIVNTFFGDYTLPQTATLVQKKLGLLNAFAFEINMPCAGPIYSLSLADMFLKSGKFKKGLLIGVDKIRDLINPKDYLMNALFGDGAGAVIVSKEVREGRGIIDFYLGSDVDGDESENYSLKILAGKAKYPIQTYNNTETNHYLLMEGKEVKNFIVQKINEAIKWLLAKHIKSVDELDYIITHQANKIVIEKCLEQNGISRTKILTTVEYLGNTASASIFITISKHFKEFQQADKNILICGMGGGLSRIFTNPSDYRKWERNIKQSNTNI
ncbi:MAG: ketoacyl-ACP synthase III [Chitinophagaceae bacterium]|nr:ketoacyl-ACP synthase III [Chitinophagaceae bacterium]